MAHMPTQHWETPVSLLPADEQQRMMREALDRHFPWLAEKEQVSDQVLIDKGPNQRGFLIGNVRL